MTEIILLLLMTVTGIFAYHQITKLDINLNPISLLDDLLLFICIPAFFLSAIFTLVPAIHYGHVWIIIATVAKVSMRSSQVYPVVILAKVKLKKRV